MPQVEPDVRGDGAFRREYCALGAAVVGGARFARSSILATTLSALLIFLAIAFCGTPVRAEALDDWPSNEERAVYARALAYCAQPDDRRMHLSDDKMVLCLDGPIDYTLGAFIASGLPNNGIFVVRSFGIANNKQLIATMGLAELLMEKSAAVVVRDYCLGICANFLFMATWKTFVSRGSLVAWSNHPTGPDNCFGFYESLDGDAPHLGQYPCTKDFKVDPETWEVIQFKIRFYRRMDLPEPPESAVIRRELKRRFDTTGQYPTDVDWMWHPRHYPGVISTKVFYESYPKSQGEVDAIVAHFRLPRSVIYDP